jgi:DNA-binding MarR family transcriptional regulator
MTATRVREEEIVDLLREVNRSLRERLMEGAAGTKRSLAVLSLLRAVDREPGVSLNELARRTYMPKSLASMQIADLSREGLVHRASDPSDQRLVRLTLTAGGKKELERWRATYRAIATAAIGALRPGEAASLMSGLRALRDAMAAEDAEPKGGAA